MVGMFAMIERGTSEYNLLLDCLDQRIGVHADNIARGEMQQKRMKFDHDNNDALERSRARLLECEKTRRLLTGSEKI